MGVPREQPGAPALGIHRLDLVTERLEQAVDFCPVGCTDTNARRAGLSVNPGAGFVRTSRCTESPCSGSPCSSLRLCFWRCWSHPLERSQHPQAQVPGTSSDCQLLASPPTDYFGIIIPLGEVRCSSTQARIHIEVTLRRDGSAVSFAARDCHKAARCILSVNASNEDIPGNQLWCTDATGTLRSQDLGRAVACETQDF